MSVQNTLSPQEKAISRRYLTWCYKTTKEDLDRIDRYFTQIKVDAYILRVLSQHPDLKEPGQEILRKKIADFREYMQAKEQNVLPKKFSDPKSKVLHPDYWYLKNRLSAIEKAIVAFLGKPELRKIQGLYENEMLRRILEAREHT